MMSLYTNRGVKAREDIRKLLRLAADSLTLKIRCDIIGSILGMRGGIDCIGEEWKKPIGGKIHTSLMGMNTVDIEKAVDMTLSHIE